MTRMFAVVLLAVGLLVGGAAPGAARASGPEELLLKDRPLFYPESITASPSGALYVSSLVTGEIVRFAPGSSEPTTFVPPGVNVGTAGVMVDRVRNVLWACAVDLSFQTESELRAFDLGTGDLVASYPMPSTMPPTAILPGPLCADIVLAWGAVYVTDTAAGRIVRLQTDRWSAGGGTLKEWSAEAGFLGVAPVGLGINGIAFNGLRMLFTTNYSTGELFAVRIGLNGAAQPARRIGEFPPMSFPDGIRWRGGFLYVAENTNGLSRVNPRTGTRTLIYDDLDQPSSLVFVGDDIWITEGQVLHLQPGSPPPPLRFKVVRRRAP